MRKVLMIAVALMSLGTIDVSAYTKDSEEYKNCAAKCAYMLDENGKVKENLGNAYTQCMSPCENGLDGNIESKKEHHQAKVEQLTKSPVEFCAKTSIIWQIVGYVFLILKIVIPLLLIIFGVIDFSKAVMAGKDDSVKGALQSLMWRAIAAVVIFFIPTIVNVVMGFISNFAESGAKSDFKVCQTCIVDPKNCDTSKDASKK